MKKAAERAGQRQRERESVGAASRTCTRLLGRVWKCRFPHNFISTLPAIVDVEPVEEGVPRLDVLETLLQDRLRYLGWYILERIVGQQRGDKRLAAKPGAVGGHVVPRGGAQALARAGSSVPCSYTAENKARPAEAGRGADVAVRGANRSISSRSKAPPEQDDSHWTTKGVNGEESHPSSRIV